MVTAAEGSAVAYRAVPTGDTAYAAEKYAQAVYALATGVGPIKGRLLSAFIELCPASERDIPKALLADHRWIRNELTKRAPSQRAVVEGRVIVGFEGRVGATLRTMRNDRAVLIAERICRVADALSHPRRGARDKRAQSEFR